MWEAACGVFRSASEVELGGGAAGIWVVGARTGLRFAAGSLLCFRVEASRAFLSRSGCGFRGLLHAGMFNGGGGGSVGCSKGTRVERH
jgi:hypothetical protein